MCFCKSNKQNNFSKKITTEKDNLEKKSKYKTVVVDNNVKWLTKSLQLN